MQISHLEARTLIQYSLDRSLNKEEKKVLEIHLETCNECITFANQVVRVEASLKSLATQYTSVQYTSLDINTFTKQKNDRMVWLPQFATVSIIFLLFLFGAWQFSRADLPPLVNLPLQGAPIPTPSVTLTNTNTFLKDCQNVNYIVKEGDTLKSIANQFNVSQEHIQIENGISSIHLKVGTELVFLVCNTTPSLTTNPPTHITTTTFSPTTSLTAYTP
jgi:LysM repeat protein